MILRITILWIALTVSCACAHAQHAPLQLVVSIAPQQYLLKKLTGDLARIDLMIASGHSPATWEPTPRKMMRLATTDMLFTIGVPFEKVWIAKLRLNFPELKIRAASAAITLLPMDSATADTMDPHIWLDPLRAIKIAENMTEALCSIDPDNKQQYRQNMQKLRQQLHRLHQQIKTLLAPVAGKSFMVFHPSWGYFARRYQLHQLAVEHNGKEPRGSSLNKLIDRAKKCNIHTVFVQEQFSAKAATAIAAELGGTTIPLNPLPDNLPAGLLTTAGKLRHALEN